MITYSRHFTQICAFWSIAALFACSAHVATNAAPTSALDPNLRKKEMKYVAGPDKKWFTEDDTLYHYFTCEYDNSSRMTSKKRLQAGPDKTPFTQDDVTEENEVYTLDAQGNITSTTLSGKPGADQIWGTKDDEVRYVETYEKNTAGQKSKAIRTAPTGSVIRIITFSYNDKGWNIGDAEYTACGPDGKWDTADDVIEKTHSFEFDASGRILKSMEYHASHNGPGPDGKWGTNDDVIFATKKHLYDEQNRMSRELKSIGPGPDQQWFTDDDELQYYTVMGYKNTP